MWIDTFRVEYLAANPGWGFHLWSDEEVAQLPMINQEIYTKARKTDAHGHARKGGRREEADQADSVFLLERRMLGSLMIISAFGVHLWVDVGLVILGC